MWKSKYFFVLCSIIFLSLLSSTPFVFTSTIQTNSPSAFENADFGWLVPENAYLSNDNYASCRRATDKVTYKTFDFEDDIPSGATINEVWAICEGYVSFPDNILEFRVSRDGGTLWSNVHDFGLTPVEAERRFNMTYDSYWGAVPWTTDMLSNANLRIRIGYGSGAGCYPNRTYFMTWNETAEMPWVSKNVEKLKVGDNLLAYNNWDGLYFNEVSEIEVHNGTWNIYDLQSGEVKLKYKVDGEEFEYEFEAHSHLTGNHPVTVYRDNVSLSTNASMIREGDFVNHIYHEEWEYEEGGYVPLENHTLQLFEVKQIDVYEYEGAVYNVRTDNQKDKMFSKYMSDEEIFLMESLGIDLGFVFDPMIEAKWTVFVDWLPIEVTWSEVVVEAFFMGPVWYGMMFFFLLVAFIFYLAGVHK